MSATATTQLPTAPRPATSQVAPRVPLHVSRKQQQQYYDQQHIPAMNPWEVNALDYQYPDDTSSSRGGWTSSRSHSTESSDSMIYPGLYSGTGFDVLQILMKVATRPNPKVNIGSVDCSVALLLCDLYQPDTPIVYASDAFCALTGYSQQEILGKNCRFLQAPGGRVRASSARQHVDDRTIRKMRRSVQSNQEVELQVTNFKKDGTPFTNQLCMIPVQWDTQEYRYSVGFQVEI